jgi:hypothetical protein
MSHSLIELGDSSPYSQVPTIKYYFIIILLSNIKHTLSLIQSGGRDPENGSNCDNTTTEL